MRIYGSRTKKNRKTFAYINNIVYICNMENDLRQSLALAFERTATEPYNIDYMILDIITEFPKLSNDELTIAIRNGSLGKYGKVYKLSTTEVCFWIREYLEEERFKTTLGI